MRSTSHVVACLLLLSALSLTPAQAGMGNRDATPKWHPEPCQGDACKADDPRSGLACQGLLCSFSSAKALQPPVTAAQAAEAQQKAAAETVKPIGTLAPAAETAPVRKKRVRHVAKSDGPAKSNGPTEGAEASRASTEKTSKTSR